MYHEKLRPMEMYSLTLSRLDVIFDMTVLELCKRTETETYELKLAELDLHDHLIKEKMKEATAKTLCRKNSIKTTLKKEKG